MTPLPRSPLSTAIVPLPGETNVDKVARLADAVQDNFDAIVQGLDNSSSGANQAPGGFANTWTTYTTGGYGPPSFYSANGLVVLQGMVTKPGNFVPAELIFQLPAGYRPAINLTFGCMASGNAGASYGTVAVTVDTSGNVTFVTGVSGGGLTNPVAWISLSGIVFRAGV